MILAQQLTKHFGTSRALDGLNLHISQGQCFGLLGPNGAGKSTFINLVYGVARRTGGTLTVFGLDPQTHAREIKKSLGVVTQVNALDESLTVEENMLIYAAFVGIPAGERQSRVDELLAYMQLDHKKKSRIQVLSGGMQRRLVFVRALLSNPRLLILDEPTTGLDPGVRHLLWAKVNELRSQGVSVLLTTHYMHEAEILCDQVAILNHGKLHCLDTPKNLISSFAPGVVGVFALELAERLKEVAPDLTQDSAHVYVRRSALEDILELQKKIGCKALQMRPTNLEDVFLKITGEELGQHD